MYFNTCRECGNATSNRIYCNPCIDEDDQDIQRVERKAIAREDSDDLAHDEDMRVLRKEQLAADVGDDYDD